MAFERKRFRSFAAPPPGSSAAASAAAMAGGPATALFAIELWTLEPGGVLNPFRATANTEEGVVVKLKAAHHSYS